MMPPLSTAPAMFPYRYGLESIPEDWVLKVTRAEELLGYIETIVQL